MKNLNHFCILAVVISAAWVGGHVGGATGSIFGSTVGNPVAGGIFGGAIGTEFGSAWGRTIGQKEPALAMPAYLREQVARTEARRKS